MNPARGGQCGRLAVNPHEIDMADNKPRTCRRKPCKRTPGMVLGVLAASLLQPVHAALINFENCLDRETINNPDMLQFVPMFFGVHYDTSSGPNPLNITVYGNVTGTANGEPAPSPDAPSWNDPNNTVGKIEDVVLPSNHYTTLFTSLRVLSFTPYNGPTQFCASVTQGECPLGPVFSANGSDPAQLRAFSFSHEMESSYQFASIVPTLRVRSGDEAATTLACVSAVVTPDLGSALRGLLAYVPLAILILVAAANIMAAMFSPWGSTDVFRWTSNYGRDEDLLRLVTPGFADCLQYIQFITLTGALSLNYPGYFQPAVAQGSWSALLFNHSFVSPEDGSNPVVDGVYAVNGTYGLDRYSQYVGLVAVQDIWPGMMIWLLVVIGAVTALTQLGFLGRWVYHRVGNVPEEDLRAKQLPFTIGNIIRIVFNFLLLPLVSLSMFQLVVAGQSPAYSVVLAVVTILIVLAFVLWVIRLIATTRPRVYLFDDLSTVLMYGPLYNTYNDNTATFALVPIFLNIIRGIAIGALPSSGIAQVVVLAICEVMFVLFLMAFRPYPPPTSMNLYQGIFSIVRCVIVLLLVAFVPSLGISEMAKGWVGYVILVLHAMMLVFGFFLNALQTVLEVVARMAGAGGVEGVATRGPLTKVFGARQLSRRNPRMSHQSMASDAAMLAHADGHSTPLGVSRTRSMSGSSGFLLNRPGASDGRASMALEGGSAHGGTHSRGNSSGMYTPTTPGAGSVFSHPAGYQPMAAGTPKSKTMMGFAPETADPYYRPPRPTARHSDTRQSVDSGSHARSRSGGEGEDSGRPVSAHLREDSDLDDPRPIRKDYAVREVDFYYRVRGPALSHTPTRKLKTGPADPTGPVSSATSWFQRLFAGKTKDKAKGFEVVRSARAPPPGLIPQSERTEFHEPYRDDPEGSPTRGHNREISQVTVSSYHDSVDEGNAGGGSGEQQRGEGADRVPQLPDFDFGDSIELPSRMGSRSSTHAARAPPLPRKSSKRHTPTNSVAGSATLIPVSSPPPSNSGSATGPETGPEAPPGEPGPDLLPSTDSQTTNRLPFNSDSGSKASEEGVVSRSSTMSTLQRGPSQTETPDTTPGVGYVTTHRTSSSIHQVPTNHPMTGSQAELVEQDDDTHR